MNGMCRIVLAAALVTTGFLVGCGGGTSGTQSGSAVMGVRGGLDYLNPLTVSAASLRWRDIAGTTDSGSLYSDAFRSSFSYTDTANSYASLAWSDSGPQLTGTLKPMNLKPNMAYQVKLVGKTKVTSAKTAPPAAKDPAGWASWQLGHYGRWWCNTDGNVSDAILTSCVKKRHYVFGYLMFDFLVTDAEGKASRDFVLNSSYHVLWRVDQRGRTSKDSAVLSHSITRGAWGYATAGSGGTLGVYAEWEPTRPLPGMLTMPVGTYPVTLTMGEESFHETGAEFAGSWPTVLGADISFRVSRSALRIADAIPAP